MAYVGSESLDLHPPPSPSVHGHLLVSPTQRLLLSSSLLGAIILTAFMMNQMRKALWRRRLGWGSRGLSIHLCFQWVSPSVQTGERMRDTPLLQSSSSWRNWTRMGKSSRVGFELWDELWICGSYSSGSDEPGSDTMWDLNRVLVVCVCVCINSNGERWELESDLRRD